MGCNFELLIGQYILLFGSMETTIHNSIIIIIQNKFNNKTKEFMNLLDVILKKTNGIHNEILILKYLIDNCLNEKYRQEWLCFYNDINNLVKRRNIYAHGMYGVTDENKLYKLKKNNNKEISNDFEYEISKEDIQKDLDLLHERYRQLFDSVVSTLDNMIGTLPKLNF